MGQEQPLRELLAERHWTPVMLALAADIDKSTAIRVIEGRVRPQGTTAIRMAESLGIGYDRMRRVLTATWKAGQEARAGQVQEAGKC